jgi:hypothetical protein
VKAAASSTALLASILVARAAGAQWGAPAQPAPQQQPAYGQPAYGQPAYGQPAYGQPGYGQPAYGQPAPYDPTQRTVQQLEQARRDDAGRKLEWVWIDVLGGFEQLGMTTFAGRRDLTAGFVPTSSSGGVIGAGVGARLLYFTILARGRIGFFNSGQLYRVGLEGGLHVPLGRVEPHVQLGVGYAAVGNMHDDVSGAVASAIALRGFYTRLGTGLDYFLAPSFSIGLDLSAELLGLSRGALSSSEVQAIKDSKSVPAAQKANADLLATSAQGWGGTFSATAVLGLHF